MSRRITLAWAICVAWSASITVAAGDPSAPQPTLVRVIAKQHTIVTTNDLSGPGSNVPGLANTYDMSLFEWNWGGRQSTFNGAGITTNANFPLTEGEAITTNDHVGLATTRFEGLEA